MELTLKRFLYADDNQTEQKVEEITFVAPFVSARMLRRTIEMGKSINQENLSEEDLDRMVDYIVELFGNQFTRDQFYDGLAAKDLISTITRCINEVTGQMNEATEPIVEKNQ